MPLRSYTSSFSFMYMCFFHFSLLRCMLKVQRFACGSEDVTQYNTISSGSIPKVAPKIFRSIKLLICKPKKIFSVNHRKCSLLHNLVESDQSTVVHQLSMINQTLCTKGGNSRIFHVKPRIFVGWAKVLKFHFFRSKLSKQPFVLEI